MREKERERDVDIIGVKMYDGLVLEAWTQRGERERECVCVCVCVLKGICTSRLQE